MSTPYYQYSPDWIILGVDLSKQEDPIGRFMVVASKELTMAELRYEVEPMQDLYSDYRWIPNPHSRRFFLDTTMRSLVLAYGDDYADALRNLMNFWSPDAAPDALPAPQRALPPP